MFAENKTFSLQLGHYILVFDRKGFAPPYDIPHGIVVEETVGVLLFQQGDLFSPRLLWLSPGIRDYVSFFSNSR
jgi:hypothetical protein